MIRSDGIPVIKVHSVVLQTLLMALRLSGCRQHVFKTCGVNLTVCQILEVQTEPSKIYFSPCCSKYQRGYAITRMWVSGN